jgi:protein required for attachment to host cells
VQQTDWHDQAERAFVRSISARLDKALLANETKSLIVVAAPRALGMLREAFTDRVRAAILEEIDHDLVKLPTFEIEKRLFS